MKHSSAIVGRGGAYRLGVVVIAIVAGATAGAAVFKVVGESQIGSQVGVLSAKLGLRQKPGDSSALDIIESIAPGTRAGFETAIVGTVVASVLTAVAVAIAIREVAA